MQIVGGTDDDRVEIFLLFQQLAEVVVGRAAVILAGALLRAVIAVDNFLARFAAGDAAGDGERMAQPNRLIGAEPVPSAVDAEQFADGIAELVVSTTADNPRPDLLTSQTATPCTSGSRKKCSITRKPWAPTPMKAILTLSLGGTYPTPPNTRRGTIEKPIAAAAVCPRNLRRETEPVPLLRDRP